MTIESLVAHYGLAALFVGAGLEGEAAVVAGGLIAHQGLFSLPGACAAAAGGSFLADQAWFAIARRLRDHRWVKRAQAKPAFGRALALLERYPIGFIFAFRFIYGFRTISPIAIGASGVRPRTFLIVNAVAAVIWGTTFTVVGYLFGREFEAWAGKLHPHGQRLWIIAGALIATGLIVGAIHWLRTRRR